MGLSDWFLEKRVRSFVNGICKTMVFGSNVHLEHARKKGIEIKLHSDLASTTLEDRPGWKKTDEDTFVHKSGEKLVIKSDYSVADVILLVILIELEEIVTPAITKHIVDIVLDEFDKYFKNNYPKENIKKILAAWLFTPKINRKIDVTAYELQIV